MERRSIYVPRYISMLRSEEGEERGSVGDGRGGQGDTVLHPS
jgi:hypothetical protein